MEQNKNALSLISILRRLLGAGKNLASRRARQLQLCETLPLGEKRFVAVIQVGDQKFLLGGATGNVSLLAELSSGQAAEAGLTTQAKQPKQAEAAKPARRRTAKKTRQRTARLVATPQPFSLSASWAAAMRNAEAPVPRIVLPH
ncbi:MAG: flagellar biosynthetic protein FliO [Terriglobia bacterium]